MRHLKRNLSILTILVICGFVIKSTSGSIPPPPEKPKDPSKKIYNKWLDATVKSLDCMRERNGLVADAVTIDPNSNSPCPIKILNGTTSPTNIGFDLLVLHQQNSSTLNETLAAVEKLAVDPQTGLFFSWYDIKEPFEVRYPYLSSVDNFHLALAFWVLAHDQSNADIKKRAQKLFDRMDFSKFINEESQLLKGGLSEDWHYQHYGTEARTLYSSGWPLGLFKKTQKPEDFQKMLSSLVFEVAELPTDQRTIQSLATWDGGAFQLLLPELLVGESNRSFKYKTFFENYARFVESETFRRGLPVPAAHSASQFCATNCEGVPTYNGKAGSIALTSKFNKDVHKPYRRPFWEAVFTPHAAILGLLASPRLLPLLISAESIPGLYDSRVGWLDGFWVSEPRKNQSVPVLLALDQQMIAMTLGRLTSKDNLSVTQRALNKNKKIKEEISRFYQATEPKLSPEQPAI